MFRTVIRSFVLAMCFSVATEASAQTISKPACAPDEQAIGWCDFFEMLSACTVNLLVIDYYGIGRCGVPDFNFTCEEVGGGSCCRTCVPIANPGIPELSPEDERLVAGYRREQCAQWISDYFAGIPSGPPNGGCIQGDPSCEEQTYTQNGLLCVSNETGQGTLLGLTAVCDPDLGAVPAPDPVPPANQP
jgi:hypothetical protein